MPNRTLKHVSPRPHQDRPSASGRGYGRSWQRLRLAFLRLNPICAMCGGPAAHADHIVARARGGSDDFANLEALCHGCHSAKTCAVDGGFGHDPKERR